MTELKMGKRPAVRPYGLMHLSSYMTTAPPSPPPSFAVPAVADWRMDANDRLGDCVLAGLDHSIAAWNAEVSGADPRPSEDDIVALYGQLSGGKDEGLVEADVLKLWRDKGLLGNKCDAYAPIEHHDIIGLQMAVAFYGVAFLGIGMPASAMDQFQNGKPWEPVPGSPIEGGHCVILAGYDPQGMYAVTWGKIQPVSYPFLLAYLDEAWALLPQAFREAGRGPSLDLATLTRDLDSLH